MQSNQDDAHMIKQALKIAHTSQETEEISKATNFINMKKNETGFIQILVQLIYDPELEQDMTIAVLASLKSYLRGYWIVNYKDSPYYKIRQQDRIFLFENLLDITVYLCDNYRYAQLLIDIIKIIGKELSYWIINNTMEYNLTLIERKMQKQQELQTCLLVLVGLAQCYKFQIISQDCSCFVEILQRAFPLTFQILYKKYQNFIKQRSIAEQGLAENPQNHQVNQYNMNHAQNLSKEFWQLKYFGLKFACKSLKERLPQDILSICHEWASFSLELLETHLNLLYVDRKWKDIRKNTNEFYFYHSVKWALKFIYRFNEVLFLKTSNKKDIELFAQRNLTKMHNILTNSGHIHLINKIQFHLLQMGEMLTLSMTHFYTSSEIGRGMIQELLKETLKFMKRSEQQNILAEEEPATFVEMESKKVEWSNLSNVRKSALWVWKKAIYSFANKQQKGMIQRAVEVVFQETLQVTNITRQNTYIIQIGLDVLFELSMSLEYFQDKQKLLIFALLQSIDQCLPEGDQLDAGYIWLSIRALRVIEKYKSIFNSVPKQRKQSILQKVLRYVLYSHPQQDNPNIGLLEIRILYGFYALESIFADKSMVHTLKHEQVFNIFYKNFQLLDKFQMEEVMLSLLQLLQELEDIARPYLYQLALKMKETICCYMDKDVESQLSGKQNVEYFNIINQSIRTLEAIIKMLATQTKQNNHQNQNTLGIIVLQIFRHIFRCNEYFTETYLDLTFSLLETYLQTVKNADSMNEISWQVAFLFRVVVNRLLGINDKRKASFNNFDEVHKYMLTQCQSFVKSNLQKYVGVLREFIRILPISPNQIKRNFQQIEQNFSKAVPLQLYFVVTKNFLNNIRINKMYQGAELVLYIYIYLLEYKKNMLPPFMYQRIWQILATITSNQREYYILKKHGSMLLSLWLQYSPREYVLGNFEKINHVKVIKMNFSHMDSVNYQNYEEKKRILMGVSNLIYLSKVHLEKEPNHKMWNEILQQIIEIGINFAFYNTKITQIKQSKSSEEYDETQEGFDMFTYHMVGGTDIQLFQEEKEEIIDDLNAMKATIFSANNKLQEQYLLIDADLEQKNILPEESTIEEQSPQINFFDALKLLQDQLPEFYQNYFYQLGETMIFRLEQTLKILKLYEKYSTLLDLDYLKYDLEEEKYYYWDTNETLNTTGGCQQSTTINDTTMNDTTMNDTTMN